MRISNERVLLSAHAVLLRLSAIPCVKMSMCDVYHMVTTQRPVRTFSGLLLLRIEQPLFVCAYWFIRLLCDMF